jgi:hypothetical protein
MPNVILKDENGEPITYNNVRTVTIPTDTGLPVSFYFGIPDATPMWTAFTNYLNSSAAASSGMEYSYLVHSVGGSIQVVALPAT